MRIVGLSDIHLIFENPVARLDDLTVEQWVKLSFVFEYARKIGAVIFQAGDLCDKPRSWFLLPLLILFMKKYGVPYYGVFGQHDTYMYSEETRDRTNLGVLEKAGLVTILNPEAPVVLDGGKVQVFGASFGQSLGKVPRKGFTVGVIHASVSDRALYPDHKFSEMSLYLKEKSDYDLILCADVHRMFCFEKEGRAIVNVGPMMRQEATEYNFKHNPGFVVYDTDTREIEWVDIPCAPAEKVLSRDHIERKKETEQMLDNFVEALGESKAVEGVSFQENLWQFVKENKIEQPVVDILSEIMNG